MCHHKNVLHCAVAPDHQTHGNYYQVFQLRMRESRCMKHRCPVCMFDSMPYPPKDYNICPCCSTEFGNDDSAFSHDQLRKMWVATGANWFFGRAPKQWNPWMQLIDAGLAAYIPEPFRRLRVESNAVEPASIRVFGQEFARAFAGFSPYRVLAI